VSSPNYSPITFVDGTLTVTPAPDGKMHGKGYIDQAHTHHHFAFRVSQKNQREYGNLEYWSQEDKRCSKDDDDDNGRSRGDDDRDYGRDHKGPKNRFDSTGITNVVFSNDPAFSPGRKSQPTVDTVVFTGIGKWNGRAGYSFEVRATDQGEPGRHRDTFSLVVKSSTGAIVASVSGDLDGGNIDSTRVKH
jgi:hypothetical protein